jgi:hypothetical protein
MKDFEGKLFQQVDELKAKVHWWIDANAKPWFLLSKNLTADVLLKRMSQLLWWCHREIES